MSSYGDFMIAISVFSKVIQLRGQTDIMLIASNHLEPLYTDLKKVMTNLDHVKVDFIDLQIKNKILGVLTNKHLLSWQTVKEISLLKKLVAAHQNRSTEWMVEQKRRSGLLSVMLGKKIVPVHKNGNVYDSYIDLLGLERDSILYQTGKITDQPHILVLPESRKRSKSFTAQLTNRVCDIQIKNGSKVTTAFFKSAPYETGGLQAVHVAFLELIQLIQQADIVITVDSLTAHLAQFLSKPHIIVYPDRISNEWLTPFSRAYGSFLCFDQVENDLLNVVSSLKNKVNHT